MMAGGDGDVIDDGDGGRVEEDPRDGREQRTEKSKGKK